MFELFSEIIHSVPPTAVRQFIGRMHGTIEDALLYKEIEETWDVQSVLCFCQFMDSVFEDDVIFPLDGLPVRHIAFYGKLVTGLIEAGELPAAAREKFDAVFSAGKRQSALLTQLDSEANAFSCKAEIARPQPNVGLATAFSPKELLAECHQKRS